MPKFNYNLFHRELGTGYFINDRVFRGKKTVFSAKNHLVKGTTVFRGRRRRTTKINVTFFVGNEIISIFR